MLDFLLLQSLLWYIWSNIYCYFEDCVPAPALTDLSGMAITCYNPASCTATTCCMEIDRLGGRSLEVDLDFNQCANYMDISVERVPVRMYITDIALNGLLFSYSLSVSNCVRLAISLLHNSKKCLFLNVILLYWITGTVYVVGLKGMLIARWDVLDGLCEKWVCFEKICWLYTCTIIFWLSVYFQNQYIVQSNNLVVQCTDTITCCPFSGYL